MCQVGTEIKEIMIEKQESVNSAQKRRGKMDIRSRHYPTNPCDYAREVFTESKSGEEYSYFQCGHPDHQTEETYRFNQNECRTCAKKRVNYAYGVVR